jgi:cyclic pyranopterin phosphate synthase
MRVMYMSEFSHYDSKGRSVMVDVSSKPITERTAKATAFVKMSSKTVDQIKNKMMPKGDILEVARVAGIMGAKETSGLIPMCHPLQLNYVGVDIDLDIEMSGVRIFSEIRMSGKTGAEMEALTAVSIAALTVYDMCKAVDKEMVIQDCRVIEKKGGKSDFLSKI